VPHCQKYTSTDCFFGDFANWVVVVIPVNQPKNFGKPFPRGKNNPKSLSAISPGNSKYGANKKTGKTVT